jgi:hypothetical protein
LGDQTLASPSTNLFLVSLGGVLGMGDLKLVLNSVYSETKLVVSENSASLYSEVGDLKALVSGIYSELKDLS